MRARIVWLALFLAPGCRTAPIELPPIERRGIESHVRAHSADDAERVAALGDRLIPQVRAIKGVERAAPLIVMCREELPGNFDAACAPSMVLLAPKSRRTEPTSLAHELSHWFSDETWARLPYVLEEGLAECVASIVGPVESSPRLQAFVFALPEEVGVEGFRAACEAPREAQYDRPHEEELRIRGIGLAAASAIGIESLRQLCERAVREGHTTVPFQWIHEALPFAAETRGSFRAAIRRRLIAIDRQMDEERAAAARDAAPQSTPLR